MPCTITAIDNFIGVSGKDETRIFTFNANVMNRPGLATLRYSTWEFGRSDDGGKLETDEAITAGKKLLNELGEGKVRLFLTDHAISITLFDTKTWDAEMPTVIKILAESFFGQQAQVFVSGITASTAKLATMGPSAGDWRKGVKVGPIMPTFGHYNEELALGHAANFPDDIADHL